MSLGGSIVFPAASDILTVTDATAMLTAVDNSITNVNSSLGNLWLPGQRDFSRRTPLRRS